MPKVAICCSSLIPELPSSLTERGGGWILGVMMHRALATSFAFRWGAVLPLLLWTRNTITPNTRAMHPPCSVGVGKGAPELLHSATPQLNSTPKADWRPTARCQSAYARNLGYCERRPPLVPLKLSLHVPPSWQGAPPRGMRLGGYCGEMLPIADRADRVNRAK